MTSYSLQSARRATRYDRWVSFNSRPIEIAALYLLTRLSPVIKVPGIGVVVSEASLMRTVLLDGEHFSKTAPGGTSDLWDPVLEGPGLLNMSGASHLELKRTLSPLFGTAYLESAIGSAIVGETDRIRSCLHKGESVDIVQSIERTAARVICTLSGYDLEQTDEAEVLQQLDSARGLLRFVTLRTRRLSAAQIQQAHLELEDLHANIHRAFDANQEGTIPATLRGFGLSKQDATAVITALIIAGTETVISHLPRFVSLLLRSGYLNNLNSNSELDAVIQEGLRVTVPTPVMLRGVSAATEIRQVNVQPGDRILLATVFACQRFGIFNPDRGQTKDVRHLWFGAGVHMCIGLPLATLEIEKYLRMLIEVNQTSPIRLVKSKIRRGTLTAGLSELVIKCPTS